MDNDKKLVRILHIGNVANYAYNISNAMQGINIASHVINWDYYHINAQPIWEEGKFDSSLIKDQFFPNLPTSEAAGFTTPDWFIQGPRVLACLTLIARNEGQHDRAKLFQRALDKHLEQLHDATYRDQMADGKQRLMELVCTNLLGGFDAPGAYSRAKGLAIRLLVASGLGDPLIRLSRKFRAYAGEANGGYGGRLDGIGRALGRQAINTKLGVLNGVGAMRTLVVRFGASLPPPLGRPIKRLLRRGSYTAKATEIPTSLPRAPLNDDHNGDGSRGHDMGDAATLSAMTMGADVRSHRDPSSGQGPARHQTSEVADAATTPPQSPVSEVSPFEAHVQKLIAQYRTFFPDRDFDPMLLRQYEHTLPLMRRLFSHYDLVIGYAIEGIWPLMAGVPYVAYEFGTIRNLPFQDSPMGKLAALTYLNSEQTIVTNSDNEAPAKRLGRPYFFLPHIVNECGLLGPDESVVARTAFLTQHGGNFIVFHPARQHWSLKRDTNWDKGNDQFFRGFALLVKETAPDARCIAVAWGETLDASKDLIAELDIVENVIWIPPQPHISMMEYICICDVVCDQFTIPTFGGIPPKAFHAGKPVVSSFDPDLHRWCFDDLPPLLPASSAAEVHDALVRLFTDKAYAIEIGRSGADWYRRENSNARVREVLFKELKGLESRA
jgi:glycosyltransferase involved in cell wall biosynthesis